MNCRKLSSTKYDLRNIEAKILANELNAKDIEVITNFINLFEDYKIQIEKQKNRTIELNYIWDYYYEEIFFPHSNKKKRKGISRSKLKIDSQRLLNQFSTIVNEFESKIKFKRKKS